MLMCICIIYFKKYFLIDILVEQSAKKSWWNRSKRDQYIVKLIQSASPKDHKCEMKRGGKDACCSS